MTALSHPTGSGIALEAYHPASGDHLCSLWTDPITDRNAAARFLTSRREGERALWILDPPRGETPQAPTGGGGVPVAQFSTDQVHLAGGHFDPERMRRFWRDQSEAATGAGASHLRAVAEMTWALRSWPGTEEAPLFESSLNPTLQPLPLSVICQYGSTRFSAEIVLAMALSHPLVVIGETVFANPFAVDHDAFPQRFASEREDFAAALLPIWLHFLHRLPSLHDVVLCLCSALPALVGAEQVWVMLTDLPRRYAADAAEDRVDSAPSRGSSAPAQGPGRLHAMWPRTTSTTGAAVTTRTLDDVAVVEATFEPHKGRLVAQRRGGFTAPALRRFTTAASALGALMRRTDFPGTSAGVPQ
ncbi:MAG: MEDS domain-containing protein [bacterium]